jgi:Group 4 capsule polysaccharide lipoprotein gfcB, YjbF
MLALSACSSSSDSIYKQYFQVVRKSFRQGFGGEKVSRGEVAAIPYASMGYRIDGGSQNLLVLASDTGGDLLWTARSKVVLLTHDGRILRSVGLAHDVTALTPKSGQALPAPAAALRGMVSSERFADFPDISAYGVALRCIASSSGAETVTILGNAMRLTRINEACRSATPSWSFVDNYWIEPDSGVVWRTRQHIHPGGEMVETEILRPPG